MKDLDSQSLVEWIPRLRRYARALTGDASAADDLVQDTLARAVEKFGLWRQGSDLRAWLFSIMHNLFVSGIRMRKETVPLEEGDYPIDRATGPGDSTLRDLSNCLQRLPAEQREVILLIGLEDMSYREAARALDIPIGTVMSRLSRGRERLADLMEGAPTKPRETPSGPLRIIK
jgi:RNA polymerase sigma-70 factor, ECF subfamily